TERPAARLHRFVQPPWLSRPRNAQPAYPPPRSALSGEQSGAECRLVSDARLPGSARRGGQAPRADGRGAVAGRADGVRQVAACPEDWLDPAATQRVFCLVQEG